MSRAVLGVFVPQLIDDAAGHGRAEERGRPGCLFDFESERVCIKGFLCLWCFWLLWRFLGALPFGYLLPFACGSVGVGDVAAWFIGQSDHFVDDGVACDAVWVGYFADDADGGEGKGEGHGAEGWGVGIYGGV